MIGLKELVCPIVRLGQHPYEQIRDGRGQYALVCKFCGHVRIFYRGALHKVVTPPRRTRLWGVTHFPERKVESVLLELKSRKIKIYPEPTRSKVIRSALIRRPDRQER